MIAVNDRVFMVGPPELGPASAHLWADHGEEAELAWCPVRDGVPGHEGPTQIPGLSTRGAAIQRSPVVLVELAGEEPLANEADLAAVVAIEPRHRFSHNVPVDLVASIRRSRLINGEPLAS